jgi:hypothetical protein
MTLLELSADIRIVVPNILVNVLAGIKLSLVYYDHLFRVQVKKVQKRVPADLEGVTFLLVRADSEIVAIRSAHASIG